jgi:hypothetical protein
MVYLEIDKSNYNNGNPNMIDKLNKHLASSNDKIFILYYMEGCGPCNATRPEWKKIKNVLSNNILNRDDVVIVSIDKDLEDKLKNNGKEPNSFPTMKYIANKGEINENYEDSDISLKDRSIDSFIEWIESKTGDMKGGKNKKSKTRKNKTKHNRKWSLKYKRRINCKRPKGFSQKQYCKYSRKK